MINNMSHMVLCQVPTLQLHITSLPASSGRAAGVVMQRILDVAHALLDADAMVRAWIWECNIRNRFLQALESVICWMFVALILVGFHGMNETFQLLVTVCTQRAVSFLDARCVAFLKRIRAYRKSPPHAEYLQQRASEWNPPVTNVDHFGR